MRPILLAVVCLFVVSLALVGCPQGSTDTDSGPAPSPGPRSASPAPSDATESSSESATESGPGAESVTVESGESDAESASESGEVESAPTEDVESATEETESEVESASTEEPVEAPAPDEEGPAGFEEAAAQAAEEGKWILVVFAANEGCEYSPRMETEVLADESVQEALSDFVVLRVDTEDDPDLADVYLIDYTPISVVTDLDGSELGRLNGLPRGGAEEFVSFLTDIQAD